MPDIPASTSTTASISVGGIVNGVLDPATIPDHDWYRINLTAGQSVTITLSSAGTTDPVPDTYLRLRSSTGSILKFNDDSGGQIDVSKIVFTATTSGTYYIDVGSWDSTSDDWNPDYPPTKYTGTYTLSVQPYTAPPTASYDTIADQLVNGYWSAYGDTARHFNVKAGGTITYNITELTGPGEATLATAALAEWSDVTGITFTPVTTGGQIVFHDTVSSGDALQAFTDSSVSNGIITKSDVTITTAWVSGAQGYGTGLDTYSFQTYVHEIGHALGLGHAGDYNGDADYVSDALFANDAWSTSIMSYFSQQDNSYFGNQGFSFAFALTPMDADIIAVQRLYGAPTTTRPGDTTYGFNSNAGSSVYNASVINDAAYTIFDSGGNDTLDYSGFAQNQTINLNPETFSNIGPETGNVMIARGTVIENAIGGSGSDTIIGNDVANKLIGNGGVDKITGGAGDDFITGGSGLDQLTGGSGNDTFIDTKSGLNGDTIMDFSVGDKIVLTDATLAGFTFNLSGNLLTYTGGSLSFGSNVSGSLVATAASGGGVQIAFASSTVAHRDVANDFNGDGRSDVLWRNDTSGDVTNWLATVNGGFAGNTTNAYNNASTTWQIIGTGDFNGDGRDDILWRGRDGQVTNWLGKTTGGFVGNLANADNHIDSNWQAVGTGDFNGDGRDDILWKSSTGQVTDWLGQLNGGFVGNFANANNNVSGAWQVAGTGDFNGDGRDDILWRNTVNGDVTDWLGQSNGGFVGNTQYAYNNASASWHIVGTGDFNGDGIDDILWQSNTGQVTNWLGNANGNGGFSGNIARADNHIDAGWQVLEVGDFNGDGRDDVLWQSSNGTVTNWLGQPGGGFTGNLANANNHVDSSWHVQPTETFL